MVPVCHPTTRCAIGFTLRKILVRVKFYSNICTNSNKAVIKICMPTIHMNALLLPYLIDIRLMSNETVKTHNE